MKMDIFKKNPEKTFYFRSKVNKHKVQKRKNQIKAYLTQVITLNFISYRNVYDVFIPCSM